MSDLSKCQLNDTLKANGPCFHELPLIQLDCKYGVVGFRDTDTLQRFLHLQAKANNVEVVVMFAVRDASCASCREHGQQLSDLAAKGKQFALVGVVKETGIYDHGILTFYQEYFRSNALYLDKEWNIWKFWSRGHYCPVRSFIPFIYSLRRLRRKGIVFGEKPTTKDKKQGGVLIFDGNGFLRFAIEEYDFYELDLKLVSSAVEETRRLYQVESAHSKGSTHDMSETETLYDWGFLQKGICNDNKQRIRRK